MTEPLVAAAPQVDVPPLADPQTGTPYRRWRMPVSVLEGVRTGDGRLIAPEALTWRDLPQSLMALTKTTAGHDEAELVGRIDEAKRVDASKLVDSRTGKPYGKGAYAIELSGVFTNEDQAARVAALLQGRFLRGVSVDLSDVTYELEFLDEGDGDSDENNPEALLDALFDGEMIEKVTAGRIMGVTITPFPAFEGAYIELLDDDGHVGPASQPSRPTAAEQKNGLRIKTEYRGRDCATCTDGQPLVAGGGPQFPPKVWFEDPKLEGPTPLAVLDDGRILGHLALWNSCHTGFSGQCVTAPRSKMAYGLFRTGAIQTAEGEQVAVGQITIDTKHAEINASRVAALRHYDHTGTAVADVVVGEDEYGPWVAGALRPDVDEGRLRSLRASSLSGDWRSWGGNLELVAILAVNVPGFPVVRELVASGEPQALVAAGSGALKQPETVATELADLMQYLPELRLMRLQRLSGARQRLAQARRDTARARIDNLA